MAHSNDENANLSILEGNGLIEVGMGAGSQGTFQDPKDCPFGRESGNQGRIGLQRGHVRLC